MASISRPTSTLASVERVAFRKLPVATLIGAAIAVVANLILFVIAAGVLNIPINVQAGPPPNTPIVPLTPVQIIVMSVIPAILAAVILALLGRFTSRPITIFRIVAVVTLLISLIPPFTQPIDLAARVVLALMHVITAAAITSALTTYAREQ